MERGGEMGSHFPFKLKRRAIIAVMGLPFTFRMEMANYIANWAKCPNLKLEVTLCELPNADEQGASDISFNILCKTAVSLLENDRFHPNCVVINFPTPTIPQLQKLLSLHVYGCNNNGDGVDGMENDEVNDETLYIRPHRLLIIECQRRSKFRWRQDVEHPDQGTLLNRRYRTGNKEPGKWEDVDKAILNHQQEGLDDYLITLAADQCCDVDVKKLVVDPFQDLKSRDFTPRWRLDRKSLFAEAIKYYVNCDDDEYKDLGVSLDYALWRKQWLEHRASSSRRGASSTAEGHWCEPGDCILRFTENLEAGVVCEACENEVAEGEKAYYCVFCSLSLHELCALAQSAATDMAAAKSMIPLPWVIDAYSLFNEDIFNKTHACYSCEKDGKRFSKNCDACVFRTHLKCQLLPTALKHSCDQHHFLSIHISWGDNLKTVYDCKACGLRGFLSSYCCNICNSEYHLTCVLDKPLHTKEIAHGGHKHSINIDFSCGQREHEYEWCGVCYDDINPDTWVYTCQHCDFVAHLYCIFPSKLFEWYKKLTSLELDD